MEIYFSILFLQMNKQMNEITTNKDQSMKRNRTKIVVGEEQ
jgi:hypothetical protein